jgi:hypothetical protein
VLTAPWKRRALAPVAPLPSGEWVPRGDQRLDDSTVESLALALHDRRHGDHVPERGKAAACARLSGAYDDVYALEPLIVALVERGA